MVVVVVDLGCNAPSIPTLLRIAVGTAFHIADGLGERAARAAPSSPRGLSKAGWLAGWLVLGCARLAVSFVSLSYAMPLTLISSDPPVSNVLYCAYMAFLLHYRASSKIHASPTYVLTYLPTALASRTPRRCLHPHPRPRPIPSPALPYPALPSLTLSHPVQSADTNPPTPPHHIPFTVRRLTHPIPSLSPPHEIPSPKLDSPFRTLFFAIGQELARVRRFPLTVFFLAHSLVCKSAAAADSGARVRCVRWGGGGGPSPDGERGNEEPCGFFIFLGADADAGNGVSGTG
ncbi:hypothetical protein BS50DRAFT_336541 [Corynespora cassiicola Philippines]|uniref:Uncharacterized protein n=1 Tax=Corynespora cassiicola Philippines TaxID=1448308 RepID=A0A2T2NVX5_CORCC|nr:hypothetical protein BS50DRAFT_336541 [Corynespora cassiicola Philippines]